MNTIHRIVGSANLLFFILLVLVLPVLLPVMSGLLGGAALVGIVLLFFLVSIVWGLRNAFYYWGGGRKIGVVDHVLLVAGVLNGLLLLTGVGLFIYFGEN